MIAIVGEMYAIRGAIIGTAASIERVIVIGTVLIGMIAVAIAASFPGLEALGRASKGTFGRMRPEAIVVVSIVGLGILGFFALDDAIDTSESIAANRLTTAQVRNLHKCFVDREHQVAEYARRGAALAAQLSRVKGNPQLRRSLRYAVNFQSHLQMVALDEQTRCLKQALQIEKRAGLFAD
jgi:hypothetical protein